MTMIEKVARAMYGDYMNGFIGCCEPTWDEIKDQSYKDRLLSSAKAAIAAMREPTDKMKEFRTNNADIFDWNCKCYYCGGHKFAVQSYIDAALKEG